MNLVSMLQIGIQISITLLIAYVLYKATLEDLATRTIRSIWVIILYILVSIYSVSAELNLQSTYVFLFGFILFMGLATLSRGQFGFGDALVIGALAWYYHTFNDFRMFLFVIAIIGIPWTIYWTWYYSKKMKIGDIIRAGSKEISVDKAQPGMVLAGDNFMHGLTKKDIERFKTEGKLTIDVKQPFPFIPVIFLAFLVMIFL